MTTIMSKSAEMLKAGGAWLGVARNWIQWTKLNGSRVTWGSTEALEPPVTVRELEEVAAISAAKALETCEAARLISEVISLIDGGILAKCPRTPDEEFRLTHILNRVSEYRKSSV